MPLSSLRRILARGPGITLALTGEAGVGKSWRAARFLAGLPARQFSFAAHLPWPRLPAALPPAPREPEWVGTLFARLERGETLPPTDLAGAVWERLSAHAPATLLIDHFHRAPAAALPVWEALAARVRAGKGVGLLLLTRGEAPVGWLREEVCPLTREQSDLLAREKLGEAYRPDLAAWLYGRAQGHPLFTLELLTGLPEDWATRSPDLPASLQAFVRSQLPAHLSGAAALALARLLLRADVDGVLPESVDELPELSGIVRRQQLAHPLYREALLPLLPPDVLARALAELPPGLAETPQGLGDAALIAGYAEHWPLPPDTRRELYCHAAGECEARQQLTRAAEFWEKAAGCGSPQSAAWLERASRLYEFYPPQKELLRRRLRALRGAVEAAGSAFPPLPVPLDWLTRLAQAQGAAREPLADLAGWLPAGHDWQAAYLDGLFRTATPLDSRVLEEWQRLTAPARAALSPLALSGVATALYTTHLAGAQALWDTALRLAPDELTRLHIRGDAAYAPYFLMENAAALAEFDAVVAGLEALRGEYLSSGDVVRADHAEQLLQSYDRARAALAGRLGQWERRDALYSGVLSYAAQRQALTLYAGALQRGGWELVDRGRFEEAGRQLREAYSTGHTRPFVLMALIDLYFFWNREERAHLLFQAVSELLATMTGTVTTGTVNAPPALQAYFMAALGLTACGDWDAALPLLAEGEAQARQAGVGHALDYGLWIRAVWHGEQGRLTEGARLAGEAADASRARGLEREANRYALWAAHYGGDAGAYAQAAAAVRAQGDLGWLHAVDSRRAGPPPSPARAHLLVLGPARLLDAGGRPVRLGAGLGLLLTLLHARLLGEGELGEGALAAQLYPAAPPDTARRNLTRLARSVITRLGPGLLRRTATGYALGDVSSDAELFLNGGAGDLWRGPLPLGEGSRGDAVAERLLLALRTSVHDLLPTDPAQAARLAAFLTESEPYDLAALRLRLCAHDLAGQPGQARRAYAQARATFAEVGEQLPESWREFLCAGEAPLLPTGPLPPSARAASRARALGVHRSTVARRDAGARPSRPGRPPRLSPEQLAELRRVMAAPPAGAGLDAPRWTLALAAEYAETRFGVRLSQAQLSRLLRGRAAC